MAMCSRTWAMTAISICSFRYNNYGMEIITHSARAQPKNDIHTGYYIKPSAYSHASAENSHALATAMAQVRNNLTVHYTECM